MSNTYQWNIIQMSCYPQYESQTNVVFSVNWICTATDPSNPLFLTASNTGLTSLNLNTLEEDFTPYASLSEEQVINWVHTTLGEDGVSEVYKKLDEQIQAKKSPPIVTPVLPWTET